MGWVDRKWFPAFPGDTCSGWYKPRDGEKPRWEFRQPDFHGTRNNIPRWVMVNGWEIPDRLIVGLGSGKRKKSQ